MQQVLFHSSKGADSIKNFRWYEKPLGIEKIALR